MDSTFLAKCVIASYLSKTGIVVDDFVMPKDPIVDAMLKLTDSLYEVVSNDEEITVVSFENFSKISNEIFRQKKSWGAIVVFYAFAGRVAVKNFNNDGVNKISSFVGTYVDSNLKDWIDEHGGWKSLINYNKGVTKFDMILLVIFLIVVKLFY